MPGRRSTSSSASAAGAIGALGLLLAACAHAPALGPDRYAAWRGRTWGDSIPLPDGTSPAGGWSILRDSTEYAISEQPLADGGRLLVLDSLTGRTARGRPLWKILDVLRLGAPRAGAQFVPGRCFRLGAEPPNGSIFAFARRADALEFGEIVAAWTIDWSRRRFQGISTRGIRCRNEGYGA